VDGADLYQYVQSNPVAKTDPMGLQAVAEPVQQPGPRPGGFPSRLKPIELPEGGANLTIPVKEALKRLGFDPDAILKSGALKEGCKGLFNTLIGIATVRCFATPQEADAYQCPGKSSLRMTGIISAYPPANLDKRDDGSIPVPQFISGGGVYNFAVRQPDGSYIFMNHGAIDGAEQTVKVRRNYPVFPTEEAEKANKPWKTLHCVMCSTEK
jgi:hypothetical protein